MCEDCGLLEDVAALTRAKAHHSVNVPGAISVLAIQGATGVSLRGSAHTHTHTHCWSGSVLIFSATQSGLLSLSLHLTVVKLKTSQVIFMTLLDPLISNVSNRLFNDS